MVYKESKEHRKNLITVWLGYKKSFDSIPHAWIIKSLQLAKIPDMTIEAIRMLMTKWRIKLHLYGESNTIESSFIDYMRGILQGDLLSLILFLLSVNLLSYLLSKEKGYTLNVTKRGILHLFFVDDLKLYASTWIKMMKLLDIVTRFTKDVGMTFGESKCEFQIIERGVREEKGEPVEINGLTNKEIENRDLYRYLGIDEAVGALGPLNKDRVAKEYKKSVRKLWNSELNRQNKVTSHNTFAVPIITPTVGILEWTKKEIEDLDIMTRKTITMTGGLGQLNRDKHEQIICRPQETR